MHHRTTLEVNGCIITTLRDILPTSGPMKMLIIGKTPAPVSVAAGHYFQGRQGQAFWRMLKQYELLRVPRGKFEDEVLLDHGYGITDIAKAPREFGNEPSDDEYREGFARIRDFARRLRPHILLFVYKRVLDETIRHGHGPGPRSVYGFNKELDALFGSRVFAFPMPGTPCTKETARRVMRELRSELDGCSPSHGCWCQVLAGASVRAPGRQQRRLRGMQSVERS